MTSTRGEKSKPKPKCTSKIHLYITGFVSGKRNIAQFVPFIQAILRHRSVIQPKMHKANPSRCTVRCVAVERAEWPCLRCHVPYRRARHRHVSLRAAVK